MSSFAATDETYESVQNAQTTLEDINSSLDSGIFFLYSAIHPQTKTSIGFAGFHFSYSTFNGRQCYLTDVYVCENSRGRKTGEMILKKAFEDIWKRQGCRYFVVMAGSEACKYFEDTLKAENVRKTEQFVHFVITEANLKLLSLKA